MNYVEGGRVPPFYIRKEVSILSKDWLLRLIFSFAIVWPLCFAGTSYAADAKAKLCVVVVKLASVVEKPGSSAAPKMGLSGSSAAVYGDLLEVLPSSDKDMLKVKFVGGRELGFIDKSSAAYFPAYEAFAPRPFQVIKDKTVPYLLPGERPLSEYDNFSLPYGAVITVEGQAEAKGQKWLLCYFQTKHSRDTVGSDKRCGWIPADSAVDLASYKPDLSKVEAAKLPAELSGEERAAVLKNGFYVNPEPVFVRLKNDDMIDAYRNIGLQTPAFITADLPLHALHLYFDRMLQKVEEKVFFKLEAELLTEMNKAFLKLRPEFKNDELSKAATALVEDYISLCLYFLQGDVKLSERGRSFAEKAEKAEGVEKSPFTEQTFDFSLFKPRGHYTLNDNLKAYFKATYMLGTPFSLDSDLGYAASFVLCKLLSEPAVNAAWTKLSEPVRGLVGSFNVNCCSDFFGIVGKFSPGDLGDALKFNELKTALSGAAKLSVIQSKMGKKFAVLPRRITFDAMVFESLVDLFDSKMNPRSTPDPLDVMAVLGSPVALEEVKEYERFGMYRGNLEDLIKKWPGYLAGEKGDNVYTSWLSFINTYFKPAASKQFFVASPAWGYKKLTTAEGTMTELKHDTILYAEQVWGTLGCAGPGQPVAGPYKLPIPRGYVEPEPELYRAMADSSRKIIKFLEGMFPDESKEYYTSNLTAFAKKMTELAGIADRAISDSMTCDDFLAIYNFSLPSVLPEDIDEMGGKGKTKQLQMALVADVATDFVNKSALYMAIGTPRRISVYVNDRSGGFRLTEGYMFSYYSFSKPLSESRMDDDQWKDIVYDKARQGELQKYLPYWSVKINK